MDFLQLLTGRRVEWLASQVTGQQVSTDLLFPAAAALAVILIAITASAIGRRKRSIRRVEWGRQATIEGQIRDLVRAEKTRDALSGEIRFIGIHKASGMGPVYMVKASSGYAIDALASRDSAGLLRFSSFPSHQKEWFTHPKMPRHYVPSEVAERVVAILNAALGAPFGQKQLQGASELITGSIPWQVHGRRTSANRMNADSDPFNSSH